VDPLAAIEEWPVGRAAAAAIGPDRVLATHGPVEQPFPLASVTKLLAALAVLVAVEEGAVELDQPAGPPGSTVRHLLAHASGLAFDQPVAVALPGRRRIYSNAGFEALGAHLEAATGMAFADYLDQAVARPLGLTATRVTGSPAHAAHSSVADLARVAGEMLSPSLLHPQTCHEATASQFPGLPGVLPGFGRQPDNAWGLGFEIRDRKSPHWTGSRNSPASYGHFGRCGTFLWVDPEARLACVALTDTEFDRWAKKAWPPFSDAVLQAYAAQAEPA
jgi:CubicO group peptidase (beta-lactamase class C family)